MNAYESVLILGVCIELLRISEGKVTEMRTLSSTDQFRTSLTTTALESWKENSTPLCLSKRLARFLAIRTVSVESHLQSTRIKAISECLGMKYQYPHGSPSLHTRRIQSILPPVSCLYKTGRYWPTILLLILQHLGSFL